MRKKLSLDFDRIIRKSKIKDEFKNNLILLLCNTWIESNSKFSFKDTKENWINLSGINHKSWFMFASFIKKNKAICVKSNDYIVLKHLKKLVVKAVKCLKSKDNEDCKSKKNPNLSLPPTPPISILLSKDININNNKYINNIIYNKLIGFGLPQEKIDEIFKLCGTEIQESYIDEKIKAAFSSKNRNQLLFRSIVFDFKKPQTLLPKQISQENFEKLQEEDQKKYRMQSRIKASETTYMLSYKGDLNTLAKKFNFNKSEKSILETASLSNDKIIPLKDFNLLSARARDLFTKKISAAKTEFFYILNSNS